MRLDLRRVCHLKVGRLDSTGPLPHMCGRGASRRHAPTWDGIANRCPVCHRPICAKCLEGLQQEQEGAGTGELRRPLMAPPAAVIRLAPPVEEIAEGQQPWSTDTARPPT